jgi:hypothetical protein
VSFAAITLCVASQCVFIVVVVDFFIDSVRKLLDTPSYMKLLYSIVKFMPGCGLNPRGSEHGSVANSCEYGNAPRVP